MRDEIGPITVYAHSLGREEVVRRQVFFVEEANTVPACYHEGKYNISLIPAPSWAVVRLRGSES